MRVGRYAILKRFSRSEAAEERESELTPRHLYAIEYL